jgi:hypothetical protein
MSLAMAFTGFVFAGTRLEAWIRGLFLVQILSAAGQVGTSMFDLSPVVLYGTGLIWALGAPVAFVLLAILFRRSKQGLAIDTAYPAQRARSLDAGVASQTES